MKKSLLELTEQAVRTVKRGFSMELTSLQIMEQVELLITSNMLTEAGSRRHPKYYGETMRVAALAVKYTHQDDHTTFGYWYKGDFYATSCNAKKHGLKSTNYLHDLKPHLKQDEWSALPKGTYYIDSMKEYFVTP